MLEQLESRTVPASLFFAGVGGATQASDPDVTVLGGESGTPKLRLEAFTGSVGDVRVALGDINGDGTDDILAAQGLGGASEVVVFDGAAVESGRQAVLTRFTAYDAFQGGVFVAAEDLNNDGFAEVITTPGLGGRGHLKVFDFHGTSGFKSTPTLLTSAYTFSDYNGEVRVTTARASGKAYVVTASGAGVPGDVRVIRNAATLGSRPDGAPIPAEFLAARLVPFGGSAAGLSVAAGDVDADGRDELFIAKKGGDPTVAVYRLFDAAGNVAASLLSSFTAFPGFQGEVRLGASDGDGDGKVEVLATTGNSGDPRGTPVKAFEWDGTRFAETASYYANPGYLPGAWLPGKSFSSGDGVRAALAYITALVEQFHRDVQQFTENAARILIARPTLSAQTLAQDILRIAANNKQASVVTILSDFQTFGLHALQEAAVVVNYGLSYSGALLAYQQVFADLQKVAADKELLWALVRYVMAHSAQQLPASALNVLGSSLLVPVNTGVGAGQTVLPSQQAPVTYTPNPERYLQVAQAQLGVEYSNQAFTNAAKGLFASVYRVD